MEKPEGMCPIRTHLLASFAVHLLDCDSCSVGDETPADEPDWPSGWVRFRRSRQEWFLRPTSKTSDNIGLFGPVRFCFHLLFDDQVGKRWERLNR